MSQNMKNSGENDVFLTLPKSSPLRLCFVLIIWDEKSFLLVPSG